MNYPERKEDRHRPLAEKTYIYKRFFRPLESILLRRLPATVHTITHIPSPSNYSY